MKYFTGVTIKPKATALRFIRLAVAVYIGLFAIQGYLIFPAYMANMAQGKMRDPAFYHLIGFSEVQLKAEDGTHIVGWSHPPENGMPIIVYFPGNAMHLGARTWRFHAFAKEGYGIFALSYRGYGKSEGSPSEEGLYADARAAIAWVEHRYKNPKIILYGESLGTGVAVQMALEHPVYAVVLQSAYTSIADVAAETYWFLPGTHSLVRYPFDSLSKISRIHCPILILHGDQDNQIPYSHGQKLFEKANAPKHFVLIPGAGHVNIPDMVILKEIHDFLAAQTS